MEATHMECDAPDDWEAALEDAKYAAVAAGHEVLGLHEKVIQGGELSPQDVEAVKVFIRATHARFVDAGSSAVYFDRYMRFAMLNFDLNDEHPEQTDMECVDRRVAAIMGPILATADLVDACADDEELPKLLNEQLARALCVVNSMKDMLLHARATRIQATCGITDLHSFAKNFDIIKLLNSTVGNDAEADVVRFAMHTLQQLQIRQYKRHGDRCYRQRTIVKTLQAGELVDWDEAEHSLDARYIVHTRSWEDVCSIDEFVRQVACNKLHHPDMWKIHLQRPQVLTTVRNDLVHGIHHEFQELHINQCMFAFTNGIYHTEKQRLYPWRAADGTTATAALRGDGVPEHDACINFFDLECFAGAPETGYMGIPTPTLDRIVEFQMAQLCPGKPEALTPEQLAEFHRARADVMAWIYCHLGRLMFPLHRHDYWQVVVYIMGMAGTGKSTLGELFFDIFPEEHIAIVSSNIEEKFGLQTLFDKPLWLCLEVKENFALNLADLQSMISGERVQVAIKNGDARMVRWKSPGMMCGNLVPPWEDKAGALYRRFVLVHFKLPVPDVQKDGSLKRLLRQEMGAIIPKLSQAYLQRAAELGEKRDLWSAMPPVFKVWRGEFQRNTDVVMAFFQEGEAVCVDPACYCIESLFIEGLREYIKAKKPNTKFSWTADTYQHFFGNNGITLTAATAPWEGTVKRARFIVGVRHVDHPGARIEDME
jgi:hypothetical protein